MKGLRLSFSVMLVCKLNLSFREIYWKFAKSTPGHIQLKFTLPKCESIDDDPINSNSFVIAVMPKKKQQQVRQALIQFEVS